MIFDPDSNTLIQFSPTGAPSEAEVAEFAAHRGTKNVDGESVDNVAYVFLNDAIAREALPKLIAHQVECRTFVDGVEVVLHPPQPPRSWRDDVMPSLQPASRPGLSDVLTAPLFPGVEGQNELPRIVFGRDLPDRWDAFPATPNNREMFGELQSLALKNIAGFRPELQWNDTLAVFTGTYACEKVLDVAFLSGLRSEFGSGTMVAGLPKKGTLVITILPSAPDLLVQLVGEMGGADLLCPSLLILGPQGLVGVVGAD